MHPAGKKREIWLVVCRQVLPYPGSIDWFLYDSVGLSEEALLVGNEIDTRKRYDQLACMISYV